MRTITRALTAVAMVMGLGWIPLGHAQLLGDDVFVDSFEDLGLPPDPSTLAPPPDKGVVYDLFQTSGFLYTGPNPIQTGVAPGTIVSKRVAVIRGRLVTGAGSSLRGATVSIPAHPEFGLTRTRADGEFDLVVNGGGPLTVEFSKEGYLPVQRQVQAPWRDFVTMDEAVLAPLNPRVTTVMAGSASMQIADGTPIEDQDGRRQAVMMFPAGVSAQMISSDGSESPLSSLNVRATEYTVGPMGPMAMPGELPGYSEYTYAVELSVDEAIAAGATSVEFDAAIPVYVENFIGFPTGTLVPAGYYDREASVWRGADNGIVLEVLSVANGQAEVDTTGSGQADSAQRLDELGITPTERQMLASRYDPGASLWRVPVTHFTPWDFNYSPSGNGGGGPPPDRAPETGAGGRNKQKKDNDPCNEPGSIIECQNQVLGERVPITGTPYSLNYRSDRTPGYSDRKVTVVLSEDTQPNTDEIMVTVSVAGQQISERYEAAPNLSFEYEWDGRDAYGNSVTGQTNARVRVTYLAFQSYCYIQEEGGRPYQRWGDICDTSENVVNARRIARPSSRWYDVELQGWSADFKGSNIGLGGWTLDAHHLYDGSSRTLYLGDGSRIISPDETGANLRITAGAGDRDDEGERAVISDVDTVSGLAVAADGTLYFADKFSEWVRRIDADGRVFTVAGELDVQGLEGDGGPAVDALLNRPDRLATGPDGSLYISDSANRRIRRIDADGIIQTVAGGGTVRADSPDGLGMPATEVAFANVRDIKVSPDGVLYIWDSGYQFIYSIGTSGSVAPLPIPAGPLAVNERGEIFSSTEGCFHTPIARDEYDSYCYVDQTLLPAVASFDFQSDGSLLIADLDPDTGGETDGAVKLAGGVPATCLKRFSSLDGNAVLVGSNVIGGNTVNEYLADPNAFKLVGRNTDFPGLCRNTNFQSIIPFVQPAASAVLSKDVAQIVAAPDGSIYVADNGKNRIFRVDRPYGGLGDGDVLLSSSENNMIYRFDGQGRHRATFNPMTGAEVLNFEYEDGLLVAMVDGVGNRTEVERDGAGTPTAIIAPFGQRTTLAVNADGFLSQITNPANESHAATYSSGGLLTRFRYPNNDFSDYAYDPGGFLTGVADNGGYALTLDSVDIQDGVVVTRSTAGGAETQYSVVRDRAGDLTVTNTDEAGAQYIVERGTGEATVIRRPTGMIQELTRETGSRYARAPPRGL